MASNIVKPVEHGISNLQSSILAQAGLDPDSTAALLHQAVEVMREALSADKITRLTYKGETVETHVEPDVQTRLKAADLLANLAVNVSGLRKPTDASPKAPVTVIVNSPGQNIPTEKLVN